MVSYNKPCILKAIKIEKQGKSCISIIRSFDENITNKTSKRTNKLKQKELKNAFGEVALEYVCIVWMNVI
jgi:hypothetical protein